MGELVAALGVDGLAGFEVDALTGELDGLFGEAFQMHFDAALFLVPADAVGEVVEVEITIELVVEVGEDVFVEGGGYTGGVVVGGEEVGYGFLGVGTEVGAEEESVAGLEVGAEALEDGRRFGWGEVADAGADVEGEDAAAFGALDCVLLGNIVSGLRLDEEAGDGGGEGCGGFVECGGADVDRLVEDDGLEAGGGVEEEAGLGGGAGAELGDGYWGDEFQEYVVGAGGEDVALGAGEVVLGECGDLLEELGAALVVEEPGWEGFLGCGGESGQGFGENGLVLGDRGRGGQGGLVVVRIWRDALGSLGLDASYGLGVRFLVGG